MNRQEKYIERGDLKGASHLEVAVYYTKGSGATPRGYYLSVRPVTVRNGMVSFDLLSGRRQLLFETSRFTARQFARAVAMARDAEEDLIAAVAAENKAA